MTPDAAETAVAQLHQAYAQNTRFPDTLRGILDLETAYAAQFQLLELREADGEQLAGWKVGLTSKAMQQQQGVHEPCLGHLLVSGQIASPAKFDLDTLHGPGFENELCLRLKKPLEGTELSLSNVAAAIDAVAPALEIIEKRCDFRGDLPLALAGNAQQLAYVTGDFIPFDPSMDLSAVEVEVSVNGSVAERALGAEVLGTPLESVRWLAGNLAKVGRRLEPGTLIMSGSFTKQYAAAKGDRVAAMFKGIGGTEARFD